MATIDVSTEAYWTENTPPTQPARFEIGQRGEMLLRIPSPDLPKYVEDAITQSGVLLKGEHHITLLHGPVLDVIHLSDNKERLLQDIHKAARQYIWNYRLQNTFYRLTKTYSDAQGIESSEIRMSVIQMADLGENLNHLYRDIANITRYPWILPPVTHITLATASTNPVKMSRGIGVYTQSQFQTLNPQKILPTN